MKKHSVYFFAFLAVGLIVNLLKIELTDAISLTTCGASENNNNQWESILFPPIPGTSLSIWKEAFPDLGDSINCISQDFDKLNGCQGSNDCPAGFYCRDGNKQIPPVTTLCVPLECASDSDCNTDSKLDAKGSDTRSGQRKCIAEGTGLCIFTYSNECACPYGTSPSLQGGCNTPLCGKNKKPTYTDLCIVTGVPHCYDQSTQPAADYCNDDVECWKGAHQATNPETNQLQWFNFLAGPVAKCCESNKCGGDIEKCLNDHWPECPPTYKYVDEISGCVKNDLGSSSTTSTTSTVVMPTIDVLNVPPTAALNPLAVDSVQALIGNAIKTLMGLLGSIALVMFVYGGILWMTSMGNAEKTKKAMQILIWSSLGVLVILSSWTIIDFVFEAFR